MGRAHPIPPAALEPTKQPAVMKQKNREVRSLEGEIKMVGDDRIVEGYAVVFNSRSNELWDFGDGTFVEVIEREAITPELVASSDVKALLYHNRERVLGRSNKGEGSLMLELDDHGLKYRFMAPHTADGDTAVELVKRGDISGSSFAFTVAQGGSRMEEQADGTILRTITKISGLYDITLTPDPAYSDTSVAVREMQASQEPTPEPTANSQEPAASEEPRANDYPELGNRYNNLIDPFNQQQYE